MRLTIIDELTRGQHYHLDDDDRCYFFGEYTARQGYGFSATNDLIHNFKKGVERRGRAEYQYKVAAIKRTAELITTISNTDVLTFVPIPPSKCPADPLYDSRLINVLELCQQNRPGFDFRELITQKASMPASHSTGNRPTPEQIAQNYIFNHAAAIGIRNNIVIFDDVLTAGSHYKAMKTTIRLHLPNHSIIGVFVARTAREAEWLEDLL
ncbi:hypothetical protein GNG27_04995 [Leclercia sp. 119287]|uniref:hypothetical protein n=1 Tax=Leclercia sp. 119287 TaxID=2681308 RepID=UPI0012E28C06|nr:hypothetical protein [Leclercia sp. 119287]QGU14040.1 hypothetical protein GNG27_04995 [Leclercia sp. 119287]